MIFEGVRLLFRVLHMQEELEDTKEVIGIRNSKNRQHNGRKKTYKRKNNDLLNITHKTKDRAKTGGEFCKCSTTVDLILKC
jgi:hypothetical protein